MIARNPKWRTFDLNTVRKQADEAYLKGTKVKVGLLKKLGAVRVKPKIGR